MKTFNSRKKQERLSIAGLGLIVGSNHVRNVETCEDLGALSSMAVIAIVAAGNSVCRGSYNKQGKMHLLGSSTVSYPYLTLLYIK